MKWGKPIWMTEDSLGESSNESDLVWTLNSVRGLARDLQWWQCDYWIWWLGYRFENVHEALIYTECQR